MNAEPSRASVAAAAAPDVAPASENINALPAAPRRERLVARLHPRRPANRQLAREKLEERRSSSAPRGGGAAAAAGPSAAGAEARVETAALVARDVFFFAEDSCLSSWTRRSAIARMRECISGKPERHAAKSERGSTWVSQKASATIDAVRSAPGTRSAISPKHAPSVSVATCVPPAMTATVPCPRKKTSCPASPSSIAKSPGENTTSCILVTSSLMNMRRSVKSSSSSAPPVRIPTNFGWSMNDEQRWSATSERRGGDSSWSNSWVSSCSFLVRRTCSKCALTRRDT